MLLGFLLPPKVIEVLANLHLQLRTNFLAFHVLIYQPVFLLILLILNFYLLDDVADRAD